MRKIKHTKNELKYQKDSLKRFLRYLPTLALKKQQLQLEAVKILTAIGKIKTEIMEFERDFEKWAAVFAEDVRMEGLVSVRRIHVSAGNVAGIDIPVFEKLDFTETAYDMVNTPLWVDAGVDAVKKRIGLKVRLGILEEQLEAVRNELRVTTQRVNLFEKVMIPGARENIRAIRIFLGDLQTAAVVTGKIAKAKIERKIRAMA